MNRGSGKSPLFFKYLLSYIFVLLLPILITGFLVYRHFVGILQTEVSDNNGKLLQQIRNTIDIKIGEMTKISAQISFQPELSPYSLQKDFYNVYVATGFLDYTVANQFLDQVLLFYRGGDYLYSSESTYTLSRFLDIRNYREWSSEQFRVALNTLNKAAFHYESPGQGAPTGGNLITYLVPIPVNSPHPNGAVLFLFKDTAIIQSLKNTMDAQGGNAIILDRSGHMITALKDSDYLHSEAFEAFNRDLQSEGNFTLSIGGVPYMISSIKSNLTGWIYMTVNPLDEVMRTVNEVRNRAEIALLVILLLGGVAIYAQMRWNYNPLRRLFDYAESRLEMTVRSLNDVQSGIEEMAESRSMLQEKLHSNGSAVRQFLLLGLLKGKISLQQFNEQGREVGMALTRTSFFVMLVALGKLPVPRAETELFEQLAAWLRVHFPMDEVLLQEDSADRQWIGIVSTDRNVSDVAVTIADFQQSVRRQLQAHVSIGVGMSYENPHHIGKSYIEAVTAMDYKLIKGESKVLFFKELEVDTNPFTWYPRNEMESLEMLIRQGDTDSINTIVSGILRRIESSNPSLHLVRCICFDMINTIIKSMYARKGGTVAHDYPDVVRLTEFTSIQELAAVASDVCLKLCSDIRESEQEAKENLIQQIVAYISAQYPTPDFSVSSLAGHLSLSLKYVSSFFKEQTGQTISDYVNHIRIEKAKHLLKTSDLPLSDLIGQIGYYDVSSFIRKFRQLVNMTPGEYRKSAKTG